MSVRLPTPELIEHRVAQVLEKRPDTEVIAVRAEPRWLGGDLFVNGRRVVVEPCTSPLDVRRQLADWKAGDHGEPGAVLVVVCDLAEHELGADVLARVAGGRLLGLQAWNAVEQLFDVSRLDPAFGTEDGWIADALLANVEARRARTLTTGGVLTRETALAALAEPLLAASAFDVDGVLAAVAAGKTFTGLTQLDSSVRDSVLRAFATANGPLGVLVAAVIAQDRGAELLAIGLVCRAVYGDGTGGGDRAAGRLESRVADTAIAPTVGAALADRAEAVLRALLNTDRGRANDVIAAAATMSDEIGVADASASDFLPAGFDRRLADLGNALDAVVGRLLDGETLTDEAIDGLRRRAEAARAHLHATAPAGELRVEHARMAARLAVWLATSPATSPRSFVDAVSGFRDDGAWVDRARRRLWRGDADPFVGDVYRRLLDEVVKRRREQNRHFAELLSGWTATPAGTDELAGDAVVPVEDVVGSVVAPLSALIAVLVVVLDGCGMPTFVELAPQFTNAGFREIVTDRADRRLTGIAVLPTVTEYSRASLLAGALDRGGQDHERRRFEANQRIGRASRPAPLFHQNRLLGAAGVTLAPAVTDALITPTGPAVVGAVVNTIDDQLKRGDFTAAYRLADLHAFPALLEAARQYGRVVVVTADHGHVLAQPDDGGTGAFQGGGAGGERWRRADRPPNDVEVHLRGTRVCPTDEDRAGVLAPWDDDFRYGARAGGYHGGATPEEVLVPVAVFLPAGIDPPTGWSAWTEAPPAWWDLRSTPSTAAPAPAVTRPSNGRSRRRADDAGQGALFDVPPPIVAAAATSAPSEPAWLQALLASAVWRQQAAAAGRVVLPEDRVRRVLAAIVGRGGVATYAAVAADAEVPQARLGGFLANLARVLNVDGYAVLEIEAAGHEVRLHRQLLAQQFEIDV